MTPLPGWPNAAEPLARTFLMVAGTGAQAIFQLAVGSRDETGRRVRTRIGALVVALVAYWACFAAAPARPPSTKIYLDYARDPEITAMLALALLFLGWSFADLLIGWVRFASCTQPPLRTGLALMAGGELFGFSWVLLRAQARWRR